MTKYIYYAITVLIFGTTFSNANDVVKWSLNDSTTATSAVDSINSFNAIEEGDVIFEKDGALTSTGTSAEFDGSSILEVPYNTTLNPDGSFSIDAWVKPSGGTGVTRSFVSSRAFEKNGFIVRIASNNKFRFYVGDGDWRYVEGPTANLDQWYHVLATFESSSVANGIHTGTAKIYVNGRLYQSKTLTYKANSSALRPFRIGGGGDKDQDIASTFNFIGDIDEVRIATGVKSSLEMEEYFNTTGKITRKKFYTEGGWDLSIIKEKSEYPTDGDVEEILSGNFKTPLSTGDNYGAIVEAYFTPSVSGSYVFKLAADDYADLYISTDKNPLNLSKICGFIGWTKIDEWDKYSGQTSSAVNLVAGQTYLLRGAYVEWWGGDHLNVNIEINGGAQQAIPSTELKPVLYDLNTNKAIFGETLTAANNALTAAQSNVGLVTGTYSQASIANLQYDLATAQAIYDDVASSGRDHYRANAQLAEKLLDFAPISVIKQWGKIIGSQLSYMDGREADKAFDGRFDTYVDTLLKSGSTGIDLGEGNEIAVTQIRYFPRPGQAGRMPNAKFEGSHDGQGWTQLHKITTVPTYEWQTVDLSSNTTAYRFYRFYDPDGNTNIAELEFLAFETPALKLVLNIAQQMSHGVSDQIISNTYLRAEHAGLYHHFITYTLTSLPAYGSLKLDGTILGLNDTFTQEDIDLGKLTFTDDQSHTNDSFSFTVADTIGGSVAESTFEIIIDTDRDGIDDATEIAGTTDWNQADTDGDGEDDLWEIENGTDPNTDTLTPAVTALEGENGVSASFWYDSPGSLANFKFDRGPMEVKKLPHIALSKSYSTNAGGSSKTTYVVARYDSYLWVPLAGEYTFELISDDGSRMYVEGVKIMDNDGTHSPTSVTHTMTFTEPGFKKIKVEYFQAAGYHTCQLLWSGPGQAHRVIPSKYYYLSIPDHQQLEAEVDSDGDFLTDILEAVEGTDPDNPDSDGDKLLDGEEYHAVFDYKTNPLAADTDGDTMNDWDEIFIFKSNPLIADFSGEVVTAFSVNPSDYEFTYGSWETSNTSVRHLSRNGFINWEVDVETEGVYLLEFDVNQFIENTNRNDFSLVLHIDGILVGRQNFTVTFGETSTIKFLTPNLSAAPHDIKLFVDNVYFNTSLKIDAVRFGIPAPAGEGEANWLENHINNIAGLITTPTSSKVSPVNIEGKSRYMELMRFNNTSRVYRGTFNQWYSDIPLTYGVGTNLEIKYQGGLKTENLTITWDETNVLDGGEMIIRKGDSLLLNIISGNEDSGIDSASVTVEGEVFSVDPDTPKEHQFNTAGTFTITGTQAASNGVISNGTIDIKVVEAPETEDIQQWRFRERTLTWPELDESLVLDANGISFNKNENGTYTINRGESLEDINILTRIGENGPIISRTLVKPFWLYELVEGFAFGTQLESGIYRVPDTVFLSPFAPDDIEVRIEVFVSGVTFEDGSTLKILKKSDFSVLGTYQMVLLKDEDRLGSTCHRIKVYQNGELVGQRH